MHIGRAKLLKRSYHTLRELGEEDSLPHHLPQCAPSPSSHRSPRLAPGILLPATDRWTA